MSFASTFDSLIQEEHRLIEFQASSSPLVTYVLSRSPATLAFACFICADLRHCFAKPNSSLFLLLLESKPGNIVIANHDTLKTDLLHSPLSLDEVSCLQHAPLLPLLHTMPPIPKGVDSLNATWVVPVVILTSRLQLILGHLNVAKILASLTLSDLKDEASPGVQVSQSVNGEILAGSQIRYKYAFDATARRAMELDVTSDLQHRLASLKVDIDSDSPSDLVLLKNDDAS